MTAIQQAIQDYIAKEFMFDKPDLILDSDLALVDEGVIDSLGIFVLVSFLEERFGVQIQPEEIVLDNFATIKALDQLIVSKLETQAAT